jgi:hypothetical protein
MIMSGFFILLCLLWDVNKIVIKKILQPKKEKGDVKQLFSKTLFKSFQSAQLEVLD